MDPRLQRRVQRYGWDKASEFYEAYWSKQLEPAQRRLLEMADIQRGERVVDVACGTGLVSRPAAEAAGPTGSLIGTDLSEQMVEAARSEAQSRGLDHASFVRMGAEDLDLPNESFDVGLCALGLMYVPNPVTAMAELLRVLRTGGRTVVAVWGARVNCGWADIFPIVDSRVKSEVCPLFFQLGTLDSMERCARDAGFVDVKSDRIVTVLEYDSPEDALGAAFAGGPVAMAYARFDEQTREEAHAEYLESIEAYRQGAGYRIPGEFVVTRAVKG